MKIDWKHLATTEGYKSLKAAYVKDVQEASTQKHPMRDKKEFLKRFNWVINRAKHHAHVKGLSISTILDFWEKSRGYSWWFGYYQNGQHPRLHKEKLKPMGINGFRKSCKIAWYCTNKDVKNRVNDFIQHEHKENSTKKKKRWTMGYKRRIAS